VLLPAWPSEAIVASFFAMWLEGIDLRLLKFKIDDNMTIPLIAGFVIWLMRVL
jgi:dolichol kinase